MDYPTSRGRPILSKQHIARLILLTLAMVVGLTFTLAAPLRLSSYQLHEGDVAQTNIRAPKRIQYESAIETKAERERAASSVQEQYSYDPSVAPQQRNKLAGTLQTVGGIRNTPNMTAEAKKDAIRNTLEFELTDEQLSQIVGMDEARWQVLALNTPRVLFELLSNEVTAERLRQIKQEALARLVAIPSDQDRDLAAELVERMARVNYFPNPAETERLQREAREAVAPVTRTIEEGEAILREGDVVRATDLEKLEALGLRNPSVDWQNVSAAALMAIVVTVLVAGYIWVFEPSLLTHEKRLILVVLVMLVALTAAKIVLPGRPLYTYIFPISAVAMLLATLLDAQLAIVVTVLLALLVASVAGKSLELGIIGTVGAVVGALGVRSSERLHSYFVAGGLVSLGSFAVVLSTRLMSKNEDWTGTLMLAGLCLVNGLLSSSLTVGFFSLLGRVFGITTTLQLLELSDPTQPLLRRLLNEAPGTYHHSIMVGNLAERAAERVGADPLLVRVGAYYHDIGKLARPYFFIENQFDGKNVHDSLDPKTSARIVASHVKDGLELAERYKLPPRIREFITEHHGTRLVTYFYSRASQEGDGEVDASQYSYPGPRPRSKEVAIVMLADSVEAVVRSVKDHSAENVAALVRKVVAERIAEGQLDECDLTMRDMDEIVKAFIAILMGMYHPRIEYPPTAITTGEPEREALPEGKSDNAQQQQA
ncbi:MAG: HD family phosphohydrolase [Chloroflexota bacterium]|jgi:putative nucleotidyltransferase with HDIG domain